MKIEVIQTESEKKNEFEIKYNDKVEYKAKLPFISINEPLNLEKLRTISIYNLNDEKVYTTDYKYLENVKEQFIPFKFLVTGSQKFNQLLFKSEINTFKIYYEENDIWKNRYVIEVNDKRYYCYSVEDGYIRHMPIYDEEKQIGEILKSNVITDAKDEYCCYLKDEYKSIADGIVALLLYLDRNAYIITSTEGLTLQNFMHDINKQEEYRNVFIDNTIHKDEPIEVNTDNLEDLITIRVEDNSMKLFDYCVDNCVQI